MLKGATLFLEPFDTPLEGPGLCLSFVLFLGKCSVFVAGLCWSSRRAVFVSSLLSLLNPSNGQGIQGTVFCSRNFLAVTWHCCGISSSKSSNQWNEQWVYTWKWMGPENGIVFLGRLGLFSWLNSRKLVSGSVMLQCFHHVHRKLVKPLFHGLLNILCRVYWTRAMDMAKLTRHRSSVSCTVF